MSLQEQLEALTSKLRSMVPSERLATIDRAIEEVKASRLVSQALQVGAHAPAFELPDGDGLPWRSQDLLHNGPLVIVFYRGRWCAYCNTQLLALQQIHKDVAEAGGSMIAISPQTVKHTYMTRDMHHLRFLVLSDTGNQVARKFGLVYRVPHDLQRMYESIMTKLPGYNGDQSWELPLAGTYVVGTNGIVKYAHVDADWRQRPEPEEILSHL